MNWGNYLEFIVVFTLGDFGELVRSTSLSAKFIDYFIFRRKVEVGKRNGKLQVGVTRGATA